MMWFLFTWILCGIFSAVWCMWLDRKKESTYKMKEIGIPILLGYVSLIITIIWAIHKIEPMNIKNPFYKKEN